MFVKMLKSKLHRAVVTDTKLHYAGSIAVDPDLMDAVGLLPYEDVQFQMRLLASPFQIRIDLASIRRRSVWKSN